MVSLFYFLRPDGTRAERRTFCFRSLTPTDRAGPRV
jgi:hypothetical protein